MRLPKAVGFLLPLPTLVSASYSNNNVHLNPRNGQHNVSIDTHLVLSFPSPPIIGKRGKIRVYDEDAHDKLIDTLDLSIPFSPSPYGNGSTKANYSDTTVYQTNIVGGMDFYFFPIIVNENTATVYLHNNKLEYNKRYRVEMDPSVLQLSKGRHFEGFSKRTRTWRFSTKRRGPSHSATQVTVAADGSADFNTVQGAIDWAPANPTKRTNIQVRNGNYTEIVYFQYKTGLTIRGEDRNKTIVGYPNNSAFNPPNRQGPSRRPAFSIHGSTDIQLSSMTIINYFTGQAEALLVEGVRVVLDHVDMYGSGDALTTYGTIYITDSSLTGDGDTILGYGSVYWLRSRITTKDVASWPRTNQGIHGTVFIDGTIVGSDGNSTFARLPDNSGGVMANWPFSETVLINTRTEGIAPVGWGPVQTTGFDTSRVRMWEYNTMDMGSRPVDYSERLNVSRQLHLPRDRHIIDKYRNPAYVLGGWTPKVL